MITLYSYFRSSCSWRVRIACNLLNIDYKLVPVNLLKNEQNTAEYSRINPLGTVPAIHDDKIGLLWQSLAIIDYLDKKNQSLVPSDPLARARCLQITNTICSEIQPLQNLSVLAKVAELGGDKAKLDWAVYHNLNKLQIIENTLLIDSAAYSVDNKVTVADICIVPQIYSAWRFGIDIKTEFPKMIEIVRKLEVLDAFKKAHAHSQPDCPEDIKKLGTCQIL